jgi:hydroxymethylglutaryl-CoA reductase (NADPH)
LLQRIPRSEQEDCAPDVVAARRALCDATAGRELAHLWGRSPVLPESTRGNVENFVGFAQVPLGIAGPLRVDTSAGERCVYVPMATNEGAMVASYSRGMRLLSLGPVRSRVVREGLSQHPVLVYDDAAAALRAAGLARERIEPWRERIGRITSHGRLLAVEPEVVGRRLILRLLFATGDAVGINMAAHAADLCSADLAEISLARERYVHGQDVEKRANSRALVEGRGRSAIADVVVPRQAVEDVLRTSPEDLVAIQSTYAVGFGQLGTHNHLIQAANGLAAVMLACGQDVAYLTECATGFLDFSRTPEGDLYASATLPSLLLGTVGGGTGFGTAAECLDLLGCRGGGGANAFAEILAAVVLAGDLSLMASFCAHEFVSAHERLGRNRPPARDGGELHAPRPHSERGA